MRIEKRFANGTKAAHLIVRIAVGGVACWLLARGFPRHGMPFMEIPALAVIVRTWRGLPMRTAASLAFFEGIVFYAIVYGWFVEAVASHAGPLAAFIDLGAAALSAWSWALAAVFAVACTRVVRPQLVPLAIALAFTLCESLRLYGPLANPFGTIGEPFVASSLAPLATIGGAASLTFAVALVAASLSELTTSVAFVRNFAVTVFSVVVVLGLAWLAWPARTLAKATIPVALVQGNIRKPSSGTGERFRNRSSATFG